MSFGFTKKYVQYYHAFDYLCLCNIYCTGIFTNKLHKCLFFVPLIGSIPNKYLHRKYCIPFLYLYKII